MGHSFIMRLCLEFMTCIKCTTCIILTTCVNIVTGVSWHCYIHISVVLLLNVCAKLVRVPEQIIENMVLFS